MHKVTSLSFQNPPEITVLKPVNEVSISVLRLDKLHDIAGGNKLYKLKYNLDAARIQGYTTILTMGGAFSNHIAATALAGKTAGFKTIGLIRGDELDAENITLKTAVDNGMELHFIDRTLYRLYGEQPGLMKDNNKEAYCIPEGGSNSLAVKGCREILANVKTDFDVIMVAVGTGTTLAGITLSLKPHQQAIGISVLKGANNLNEQVAKWIRDNNGNADQFSIVHDYHFGGYAKQDDALQQFVDDFNKNQPFKIEPIYTGRTFFALMDLIKSGKIKPGTRVLAVHTGGLQYIQQ